MFQYVYSWTVSGGHALSLLYRRNEEFDDKVLIRKLKEKIHQLKQEIEALNRNAAVPANDAHVCASIAVKTMSFMYN